MGRRFKPSVILTLVSLISETVCGSFVNSVVEMYVNPFTTIKKQIFLSK